MIKKIILASSSAGRRALLSQVGLKFEVDPSNYQEDMSLKLRPKKLAEYLSLGKAKDVAKRHENAVIIAADTFCVFRGELMGKPKTAEIAKEMLKKFSGKAHSVVTGLTIIDTETNQIISKSVSTKIYFRNISEREIDAYIATGEPLSKAGAYAIQGMGALFVKKIEGDFLNIIGIPIVTLVEELKKFGVNVL